MLNGNYLNTVVDFRSKITESPDHRIMTRFITIDSLVDFSCSNGIIHLLIHLRPLIIPESSQDGTI